MVVLFMLFLIMAFVPGADGATGLKILEGKAISWIILGLMVVFFLFSASYVFNLAINVDEFLDLADNEWFGFFLLAVVGGLVSFVLFKAKSGS